MKLTLLVRAYCHLCDEMREALAPLAAARGATISLVDVDANPALEAGWGDLVPVLFAGDPAPAAELCHYRLDRERVEAALAEVDRAAGDGANVVPSVLKAVRAYATVGEIVELWRKRFGSFVPSTDF
jgi:thioredoxin reductase (NADPH)